MPSLLARLRNLNVSLSPAGSSQTTSAPPLHTTSSTSSAPATPHSPLVDLKIHPNLDALLEDYSEQEPASGGNPVAEFGLSVRPSSRRHSADTSTRSRFSRLLSANKGGSPGTLDDVDETMETTVLATQLSTPDPALGDDSSRARRILDRISYLASSNEWSTFGRSRDHPTPSLGDFGQEVSATQPSQLEHIVTVQRSQSSPRRKGPGTNTGSSVRSESIAAGNTSSPSTATAPEEPSSTPSMKSSFKHPESQGHESRNDSKYSSASSSRKNQGLTTPSKSRPNTSSFDVGDSPRTFGYPTPPEHHSVFTFGSKSGGGSPPPLPPFNHPELTAALRAKSSIRPAVSSKEPDQCDDTVFESIHDGTIHQRSGSDNAFASLPFGKLRSRSKSLPQVQQIFGPSSLSSATPPTRHSTRKTVFSRPRSQARTRTRTASGRRSSADWSAKEASFGDRLSWPVQVSREMLRLSFGEACDAGPAGQETRAHVTYPSSHNLPPSESLGSPFLEAGVVGPGPSHDHSGMKGKDRSPVPTTVTNSKSAADGSRATGNGASERRSTPSPPKKGASSLTSVQSTAESSSSSSKPTAVSVPLPMVEFSSGRRSTSEPGPSVLQSPGATPMKQTVLSSSPASNGKRKAEDVDVTPPDRKKEIQRATFSIPPRPHRISAASGSSYAPSSYHRKRPRLSAPTSLTSTAEYSLSEKPNAGNTGSWASRASSTRPSIHPRSSSRAPSRAASNRSAPAEKPPRSSMSQVSIPISALISPHAPSVGRSSTFHMNDPRKPPRKQPTGWSLRRGTPGEPGSGSPFHAWCFFIGFIIFPIWWVASFWSTPETRLVGGTDVEKAVTLDDPQVEHDAKSWRLRCRVMSVVSLLTYIPFIVLVAVFVPS